MVAAAAIVVTLLAAPLGEWIGRAPEIGASIKQKLYVFDRPLGGAARTAEEPAAGSADIAVAVEPSISAWSTPVLAVRDAGSGELVIFFATLIFLLAGQMETSALSGLVLHQPRRQAALHAHRQRYRAEISPPMWRW